MIRQAPRFDIARFRKHAGTLALTSLAGLWALSAAPAGPASVNAATIDIENSHLPSRIGIAFIFFSSK